MRELRARLIGHFLFRFDLDRKVGRGGDRQQADRRIDEPYPRRAAGRRQNIAQQRQGATANADKNDAALFAKTHRQQDDHGIKSRKRDFQICNRVGNKNPGRQHDRGDGKQRCPGHDPKILQLHSRCLRRDHMAGSIGAATEARGGAAGVRGVPARALARPRILLYMYSK
jgi:hypothetical protein